MKDSQHAEKFYALFGDADLRYTEIGDCIFYKINSSQFRVDNKGKVLMKNVIVGPKEYHLVKAPKFVIRVLKLFFDVY
jgi:hypothetical protein